MVRYLFSLLHTCHTTNQLFINICCNLAYMTRTLQQNSRQYKRFCCCIFLSNLLRVLPHPHLRLSCTLNWGIFFVVSYSWSKALFPKRLITCSVNTVQIDGIAKKLPPFRWKGPRKSSKRPWWITVLVKKTVLKKRGLI